MDIRIHSKDLPEDGLFVIKPSDPSFDSRFAKEMEEETKSAADFVRPFSVLLENRSNQTVVAYMIQWCFTRMDGTNDCYRKAFVAPRALMEGEELTDSEEARSGKIRPNSSLFLALISPDGKGAFRVGVPANSEEIQRIKEGISPDLTERVNTELAKYTDVVVTVDGAFFDDGTFVGDDVSGFFLQIKSQISAKHDLLKEIEVEADNPKKSSDDIFRQIEAVATQETPSINPKSTAADHYNYYRHFYARQILSSRQALGDEKALKRALREVKKPWRVLRKNEKKDSP